MDRDEVMLARSLLIGLEEEWRAAGPVGFDTCRTLLSGTPPWLRKEVRLYLWGVRFLCRY